MKLKRFLWGNASEKEKLDRMRILLERKVIKTRTGCWEFTGSVNKWGYGEMHIGGKLYASHHNAHRISWMVYRGKIQKGMVVCHACDNRACCNPDHLFLGSYKDNMQDMISKGRNRTPKGEDCSWSILKEKDILEILKLFEEGFNAVEIGKRFNISRRHASDIKRGRRWGHIGDRSKIKKIAANKKVLNKERVKQIKQKFKNGSRIIDLVHEFNINRATIDDVIKERTWKHVKLN